MGSGMKYFILLIFIFLTGCNREPLTPAIYNINDIVCLSGLGTKAQITWRNYHRNNGGGWNYSLIFETGIKTSLYENRLERCKK